MVIMIGKGGVWVGRTDTGTFKKFTELWGFS